MACEMDERLKPLKIEWLLTRKCNLKCSYCNIRNDGTLLEKPFSLDQVIQGLNWIQHRFPNVPVIFFGGEPTMLPWIPDLIRYCEKSSIKYAIISNSVRVLKSSAYFDSLIRAGISNWSVSIDIIGDYHGHTGIKSKNGLMALRKFKERGVKDLVACITVTALNILQVPQIVKTLSAEGIWSITTPLILGKPYFEYSQGAKHQQCTDPDIIHRISFELFQMAKSGEFLMHNSPEYYTYWDQYFISQDWKCSKKYSLTIDADGSLKRCVDVKGGFIDAGLKGGLGNILALYKYEKDYCDALDAPHECPGCFWDPAFETELKGKTWNHEEAIKSFRHEK